MVTVPTFPNGFPPTQTMWGGDWNPSEKAGSYYKTVLICRSIGGWNRILRTDSRWLGVGFNPSMVGESYLPWFLMFLPRKNRVLPQLRVNSSVWRNSSKELSLQELTSWKINWVCESGIPKQETLTHTTHSTSLRYWLLKEIRLRQITWYFDQSIWSCWGPVLE